MSIEPLVVYDCQSAVAVLNAGNCEELVALAHDDEDYDEEIDLRRRLEDDLYLSLSVEDKRCSGWCLSACRTLCWSV